MLGHWKWLVGRITGRLWFWAVLYGVLAVVTAMVALAVAPFIPERVSADLGADAVENILNILASSMLAVATFSLSTMVTAFGATTRTATPRAARLLIEDRTAQIAVATFVGAFIYGLVGIVALRAGIYGSSGRLVLFGVTILVIATVVVTFFRWIDYLFSLGRLGEVIAKVETVAHRGVIEHYGDPHLGARARTHPPDDAVPIPSEDVGYLQHIDLESIDRLAARARGEVHVAIRPGDFVEREQPLAWVSRTFDDAGSSALRDAFLIGAERSFRQDPRFGLVVLAEVATRALSTGVNDPGTAIDILGRVVRILSDGVRTARGREADVRFVHVGVTPLDERDFLADTFAPIARDAAGNIEVNLRLQRALLSLARLRHEPFDEAIRHHSAVALRRAEVALQVEGERAEVRRVAIAVSSSVGRSDRPPIG